MAFTWERPSIAGSPISAIVPHQQGPEVNAVLTALVEHLQKRQAGFEVLLVSPTVPEAELGQLPNVKGLQIAPWNYGAGLRAGLDAAQHPLICTIPADGSYDPADLPKLLELIDQADIVSGMRMSKPWLRRKLQGVPARVFFGVALKDVACHFRLYRREIFKHIPIQSRGCFADTEILAKANFLNCILAETEITWKPPTASGDLYGKTILGDAFRVFRNPDFGPPEMSPAASAMAPPS